MKHLKTFEAIYKLNLDDAAQKALINHALKKQDVSLLDELINQGILIDKKEIFDLTLYKLRGNEIDLTTLKSLLNFKIFTIDDYSFFLLSLVDYTSGIRSKNKTKTLQLIKILLDKEANPFEKKQDYTPGVGYGGEFKYKDFFDLIEDRLYDKVITKSFYDKIINLIKTDYPLYYEMSLVKKNTEKYNL